MPQADPGGPERASEINQDHGNQGSDRRSPGNLGRRRQLVQRVYGKAKRCSLFGKLFSQGSFPLLHFFHGKFRGIQVARNLRIEVAADKTAQGHHQHAPEGHSGDVAEFERRMKGNDDGSGGAEYDVEIQPVAGIPLPSEPAPFFAERIEVNQKEHQHAQHAEPDADGPAGAQDLMLWRERPLGGAERVIVVAVTGDDQHDGHGQHPREEQSRAMTVLRIVSCHNSTANACRSAHGLASKSSTRMVARNLL